MEPLQLSTGPVAAAEAYVCELCQQNEPQLICQRDRRGKPLATVLCRNCGLVSHAHIPSDQQLADYYEREYRRAYHGEFTPSAHRVAREWRRSQCVVQQVRPYLTRRDKVLDVGAGIGCTVKQLELTGFKAVGLEPGAGFAQYSQRILRASVSQSRLEDLPAAMAYDVVLLIHVLEHFNHPRSALRRIWRILQPGGRLFIEVPNFGAPHAAPGSIFHCAHIYNFTPATLRMLGQAAGFKVEQLTREYDKNLRVLMRKTDSASLVIEAASYRQSLRACRRYNRLTYHLRWRYLTDAVGRLLTQFASRIASERKVAAILDQIENHARARTSLDRPPRYAPGLIEKPAA